MLTDLFLLPEFLIGRPGAARKECNSSEEEEVNYLTMTSRHMSTFVWLIIYHFLFLKRKDVDAGFTHFLFFLSVKKEKTVGMWSKEHNKRWTDASWISASSLKRARAAFFYQWLLPVHESSATSFTGFVFTHVTQIELYTLSFHFMWFYLHTILNNAYIHAAFLSVSMCETSRVKKPECQTTHQRFCRWKLSTNCPVFKSWKTNSIFNFLLWVAHSTVCTELCLVLHPPSCGPGLWRKILTFRSWNRQGFLAFLHEKQLNDWSIIKVDF